MDVQFFKSPAQWRKWLARHHSDAQEIWVGFPRKSTGNPGMTWPEAVDEALCFGWIDGIRKRIDESSYTIRFTPRKAGSIWSALNVRRAQELTRTGRMHSAGLKAFQERDQKRSGVYSYEQRSHKLADRYEKEFMANPRAWNFFRSQAPWYQRTVTWWVMSPKKEETRLRRLAILIEDSARGRTIPQLRRPTK